MAHSTAALAGMRGRAARGGGGGGGVGAGGGAPTSGWAYTKAGRALGASPRAGGWRGPRPGLLLRPLRGNASGDDGDDASRAQFLSAHDSPSTAYPGRLRRSPQPWAPGREAEGEHTNTPPFVTPGRKMAAAAAPGRRGLRDRQAPRGPSLPFAAAAAATAVRPPRPGVNASAEAFATVHVDRGGSPLPPPRVRRHSSSSRRRRRRRRSSPTGAGAAARLPPPPRRRRRRRPQRPQRPQRRSPSGARARLEG
ncbi:uncharacterized protein [Canis lupus baileyi]|uniref:uncharacterized protein n=1 Tax=Canis lupus baileyi TaxID=143281 RepID=UPI003B971961